MYICVKFKGKKYIFVEFLVGRGCTIGLYHLDNHWRFHPIFFLLFFAIKNNNTPESKFSSFSHYSFVFVFIFKIPVNLMASNRHFIISTYISNISFSPQRWSISNGGIIDECGGGGRKFYLIS